MKSIRTYLLCSFAVSGYTFANQTEERNNVKVYNDHIQVSVSSLPTEDESQYWQTLKKEGWKAVQKATGNRAISVQLREELTYRESLAKLQRYFKQGDFRKSAFYIQQFPQWQSCQRIQWLWGDLQSEVHSGYGEKAKEKYQHILDNCTEHRLSSVQKLLEWTKSPSHADILNRFEQSHHVDPETMQSLRDNATLATLSTPTLSAGALHRIGLIASERQDSQVAEALGWKWLDSNQPEKAREWFSKSIKWSQHSEQRVKGLLYSLKESGQETEFKRIRARYIDTYPELRELAHNSSSNVQNTCQNSDNATCLQALNKLPTLTAEETALKGWKLYELNRPYSAINAFEQALVKMEKGHKDKESTLYGYILALKKSGFLSKADTYSHQIMDQNKRYTLKQMHKRALAFRNFNALNYKTSLQNIKEYERDYGPEIGLTEIKAWALFHSNKKTEALKIFETLTEAYPMDESYRDSYFSVKCNIRPNKMLCPS